MACLPRCPLHPPIPTQPPHTSLPSGHVRLTHALSRRVAQVKKGRAAYAKTLTETEKESMKLMDTVRGLDVWTEMRLQYEIRRGKDGDLAFIKARHGPRDPG